MASRLELKGKRVTVIGLGVEGRALVRYLCGEGAQVTASDSRPAERLAAGLRDVEGLPVRLSLGGNQIADAVGAEVVFVSPGVPLDIAPLAAARQRGIPFSSVTRLFFERCPAPIIAITGSNGKTTTTSLVAEMLKAAGRDVFLGGNIGQPLLESLPEIGPGSWVVLELSSFQLQIMEQSPHIAAVTNVTPNHLDQHRSMEEYIEAKRNIVRYQRADDFAALGYDNAISRAMAHGCPARVIFSSRETEPPGDAAFLRGSRVIVRLDERESHICDRGQIPLLGEHNVSNVIMASAIAMAAGVGSDAIAKAIDGFRGVAHRLEPVRDLDGVTYYNDSIATSPERAVAGLRSFTQPIVLIAGGREKHLPLDEFVRTVQERCRAVVLYGEAAPVLKDALRAAKGVPVRMSPSFAEAPAIARGEARPGDVVLLSPACTSYDLFANFEERGDEFKRLVQELKPRREL
ncbi:MAG: UDP-N-acetylmuramoyl-L-alanine--D-glutamate ligase [Chloroflexi bacterium]|nr:UDP-N-acetylmuramoyl-L-alanine--D-glutamate ligase [Chloroflexota bacterium]